MKTFILILLALAAGYIAGRCHSPVEVTTRHVEGPPVTGSVALPSRVPDLPRVGDLRVVRLVFITDTIRVLDGAGRRADIRGALRDAARDAVRAADQRYPLPAGNVSRPDTSRVIDTLASYRATVEDWNEERRYRHTLFDNLNGKLDLDLSVRFNTLTTLDYAFTPIRTETTIKPRRGLSPFAGVSFGVSGTAVGGGLFYCDVGIAASYVIKKGIDVHLLYSF
jgi:hypothetical protein